MRLSVLATPLLALLSCLTGTPALAFGEFSSGQWQGMAVFQDARFSHCAMRAIQNGWRVAFSMDEKGAVNLGIDHRGLNFTRGTRLDGSLQLDGGPSARQSFVGLRLHAIGTRLGTREATRKLTQASRFTITVGEIRQSFNLIGISEAFARLEACVAARGMKAR